MNVTTRAEWGVATHTAGRNVEVDPVLGDGYFHRLSHPCGRQFLVHDNPARVRRHPAEVRLGPLLGEHTHEILHNILGLSADAIAEFVAAGATE